jgi:hypothetical protein
VGSSMPSVLGRRNSTQVGYGGDASKSTVSGKAVERGVED